MERTPLTAKICILIETQSGELFLLETNDYNELINDHYGEHKAVPAADARVFFASYGGTPINPYAYTDFTSLVRHIRSELF